MISVLSQFFHFPDYNQESDFSTKNLSGIDWQDNCIVSRMKYKILSLTSFIVLVILFGLPSAGWATELPEQAYVEGVKGHRQFFTLSCEARSAVDVANFWGVDVTEKKFLKNLPRSENPDKGFVGSPNGVWGNVPPASYGVHAGPIAETLNQFGLDAKAHVGLSLDDLRREIAAGHPVIVWVIGQMDRGSPIKVRVRDGSTVRVAYFEHTMILVGYDPNRVYVVDAYTGQEQVYPFKTFTASWKVLDRMAVTVSGKLEKPRAEEPAAAAPECAAPAPPRTTQVPYIPPACPESAPELPVGIGFKNRVFIPVLYQPGAAQPVEENQPETYKVRAGDNLMAIARSLGLDWKELARWNALQPPYTLHPGQLLVINDR
jgi:uncharacterized protein YvpB